MKISKIDHISINVTDIRKSLDFYGRMSWDCKQLQTVDCGEFDITYFALPGGAAWSCSITTARTMLRPRDESDSRPPPPRLPGGGCGRAREVFCAAAGVEITLPTCDLPNLGRAGAAVPGSQRRDPRILRKIKH